MRIVRRVRSWGAALAAALAAGALGGSPPAAADEPRIADVQGVTRVSPMEGERVDGLPGIVTGVDGFGSARGFWFQDPRGGGDPRASRALFVFTGSDTPDVEEGDQVEVSGTVQEYRPDDPDGPHQSITQLSDAEWRVLSRGNPLPEAVVLDPATVPDTYAPDHGGDTSDAELRPEDYALDLWASLEHMRVRIEDARIVGPTDAFGGLWVTTRPDDNPTPRGGTFYGSYADPNPGRLKVESLIPYGERPFPELDVGDELGGATEGPLHYSGHGGYAIQATVLGDPVAHGLERVPQRDHGEGELAVATYNVENLSAQDDRAVFDRLAEGIVEYLRSPDILSLEEIQDDSGPEDDGTVTADRTLDLLAAAVKDAGGPAYEWREIAPQDGRDGGEPGGNIRNAYLFNPERVEFVDLPGGDATTPVGVTEGERGAELDISPGRIKPEDPAWNGSRKPLVGWFRFEGRDVFAVTNHFTAKLGDDPLYGVRQPPERPSEEQRHRQAALVRDFAEEIAAVDPDANVVALGDFNDFEFSETLEILTEGTLRNPMLGLPPEERYTYVFDGNSQALDHILVSAGLEHRADYDIVRINAEFHDQASDHDPAIVRFRPLSGSPGLDAAEDEEDYGGAAGSGGLRWSGAAGWLAAGAVVSGAVWLAYRWWRRAAGGSVPDA